MPVQLVDARSAASKPIHPITKGRLDEAGLPAAALAWAKANDFSGQPGRVLVVPGADGAVAGALIGLPDRDVGFARLVPGALARDLPEGDWHFAAPLANPTQAAVGLMLGGYRFTRYSGKAGNTLRITAPDGADGARARRIAEAVSLTRDLVNTPTNDLGPAALEDAARALAQKHDASVETIVGDDLLARNFPMIHAVGRASADAPRLIDMAWGRADAPKVTLVGKGVCFDTGGLDIKPSSSMLLMKKDMGGAANVLGLADMIMGAGLTVRLRVLIPAVENAIAGNAFRPGDVLKSRKGPTVEIGNTDAEGRLVLADALALADEEAPDLMIDMATLTGAARVAVGPDIAPFYTGSDALAAEIASAALEAGDPVWRMPLWAPYDEKLASKVADVNNVTSDGFAGSITAALFLQRFVEKAKAWSHFDIFAWNPAARPHGPAGGEAQAIRALEHLLAARYGN
ncbi:leucyl aminopeptidase family protein [Aquibium sp. ELW1220]|uniref:leucyl aminopeptidase family protein n=1 Tax=Aquibium sp. ELW1220 TaxID=2976766 RepID=UPI0025B1E91D|nr:leucyl aminopeptidase family protein [Aquibium sp. ELW1220]MDN2578883.1 leucyl aminopeptidase family protein [Aquibium sp. ELW1220]